ncbi:LptA/OstA family protein [Candidatus Methylomirabilis sp.]|uniref:OstA-like protein n=1 Tax=Candidatus Methylomirabilis tolerans TaxID=3123416 RepID=A0AAJ1AGA4_9BACT|nr:OstA-like protein [Candidatus Methylomirabilis sp.]
MSCRGWVTTVIALMNCVLLVGSVCAQEQQKGKSSITITSDRLEVNRKLHSAIYTGNVMVDDKEKDLVVLSDKMEFLFDEKMERIEKGVASGNVRLTKGEKKATGDHLELFRDEDRAVLTGDPRVWQDNDLITGTKITVFLKEDRAIVEGDPSKRVTAILYPKPEGAERSKPETPGKGGKPAATKGGS